MEGITIIKRIYKKRKIKKLSYSPRKLKEAIKLVKNGTLTAYEASKKYDIPRTTLIYKAKGVRPEISSKPGPQPMLGYWNEEKLVHWVQQSYNRGLPLTKDSLLYAANQLFQEGHSIHFVHTFDINKGPGRRWYEGFMSRHPNLTLRKAGNFHKGRVTVKESVIRKWFENIRIELKDHLDIFDDPRRIFSSDETFVFLHPKKRPLIATKDQRTVYGASGTCNKENMTILITGNAAGDIAPPLALVASKKIPSDIAATANPEWEIGITENGLMTRQSFFEYVANIFEPYLKNTPKPVVLFVDGHSSHLSLQLSQFCLEKQIILVGLPPNASYLMQPLDVSFFDSLEKFWCEELDRFKIERNIEPKKCHVLPVLESVLAKPNFKEDLKKGFAACGLCPFNPDLVDCRKRLDNGSKKTNNDIEINGNDKDFNVLMNLFEQRLPISLKKKFDELDVNDEWHGNVKLSGLFSFYKAVKFDLNFEDLCMFDSIKEEDGLYMEGVEN